MADSDLARNEMFTTLVANATMATLHDHTVRLLVKTYAAVLLGQTYTHLVRPLVISLVLRLRLRVLNLSYILAHKSLIRFPIVSNRIWVHFLSCTLFITIYIALG